MIRHRRTRRGVSLTEVLVALFIMALGMIALLTLFPLGAMQIGQALKDDRTSQTASQADGFLRMYWRTVHAELIAQAKQPGDPFVWAFDDPNLLNQVPQSPPNASVSLSTYLPSAYRIAPAGQGVPQATPQISVTSLIADQWVSTPPMGLTAVSDPAFYVNAGKRTAVTSYPVLVDPLGFLARQGAVDQSWVAGFQGGSVAANPGFTLIPRRNLNATGTAQTAYQTCVLLDDMTFDPNGSPQITLSRQGRYSWAALLQRTNNDDSGLASAKFTVMVFDNRPPLLASPGDEVMVNTPVTVGQRSLPITVGTRSPDQAPLIRRGGWILDGTCTTAPDGIRNANFYRVTGVTETGTDSTAGTTSYMLDLETPIKAPVNSPATTTYTAQIYLFAGLSEIFERPALQPDPDVQP